MKKYLLKTYSKKFLADTLTPVSVYLRIRDKFHNSLLLESSDYSSNNKNFSYICCNPIASIELKDKNSMLSDKIVFIKIIDLNYGDIREIIVDNKLRIHYGDIFYYKNYEIMEKRLLPLLLKYRFMVDISFLSCRILFFFISSE